VVAWREAPVAVALTAAGRRIGLDVEILAPPEAAQRAARRDLVLAYLDVRPTLDGVEPGIAKLRGLRSRGVTVLNGPEAIRACHDKLVTALRLGRAGLPHPETAYLSAASTRRDVSRLRFPMVVKPRFGSRRCSGIWPPSKPTLWKPPERDFWPLLPRPAVLPCPEPGPRPTRLR